ncbi:MAG: hypothetical protein WDN69_23265 [Aliidongia sp.]
MMTKCARPWPSRSEELKLVVEPGGAVALAAALGGRIPGSPQAVVVVASGG